VFVIQLELDGSDMLSFGYQDKTWGVTDCTLIALMQLMGFRRAFVFDEHFVESGRKSGFEVIP
jgi:predicted nucleic acid-binding protein